MPALQIRDLPQGTYDALKLRAEREHRSMAQQATVAIEEHLRLVPPAPEPRRLTEEIDAMPKIELPEDFPSVVEIIHQAREERLDYLGC